MGIAHVGAAVADMKLHDHTHDSAYPSLNDVPDELLARALNCLDAPSLSTAEWACRRFRRIVLENDLWREQCLRACPELGTLNIDILVEGLQLQAAMPELQKSNASQPSKEVLRATAFYKLHCELTAPDSKHSLLANALSASSTDNPEESVENVVTPLHRFNPALGIRSGSYWSSKGSDDENSSEWLALRLAHPLCLVSAIGVMPFLAFFQRGHPIYAPKAVRFVFSCGEELKPRPDPALDGDTTEEDEQTQLLREDCEAAGYASLRNNARFGAWETRTEAFPMHQNDSLQMFEFKPPRLCVGGLIKVELLGRTQRQEQDMAWYTCINHVKVLGKPLHNFIPANVLQQQQAGGRSRARTAAAPATVAETVPPLVVAMVREDPMLARGGLMALSEGGLLSQRLAIEANGVDEADTDDEMDLLGGGPGLDGLGPQVGPALLEWFAPLLAAQAPPPQQHAPPDDGT
ncbi:F-box protein At4g00755 [Coccomyxa sp. Obi]|nr:F-box protein At4g00755 [Coccomyxa sp. Obi]